MKLIKVKCWLNHTNSEKTRSVLAEKRFLIRTAKTPEEMKKHFFDLAFYMKLTKATTVKDFTQLELAEVVIWHSQNYITIAGMFENVNGVKLVWS